MKKALVVLSGGQDSTTCLAWAKKNYDEVHAVTIDYGQRHAIEIEAARRVAEIIGVASHEVISIPGILTGRSFLTDKDAAVEEFPDFDAMEHHNAFKENKLDSSFVPMRNALFLNIAANRAYVLGAEAIITGVTAADFAEYAEFSWAWLGGYVEARAKSCKTENGPRITIPNSDPEFLRRLSTWLQREVPGIKISQVPSGIEFDVALLANQILPYMYGRSADAVQNPNQMTSKYIAGFWEGCGEVYGGFGPLLQDLSNAPKMALLFYHTNQRLLNRILATMAGKGMVFRSSEPSLHKLVLPMSDEMYPLFRSNLCCLSSFEKMTEARHGIGALAGGFNPPYPDCSPDFIFKLNQQLVEALRIPDEDAPQVIAPLMFKSKAQSVLMAARLPRCMEALAYSHTSYDGKYPPTGRNHANLLRAKGFEDAGVPDPLVIRAWQEDLMELPASCNYAIYQQDFTGENK